MYYSKGAVLIIYEWGGANRGAVKNLSARQLRGLAKVQHLEGVHNFSLQTFEGRG